MSNDSIACTICGMAWTVSLEDPDATMSDAAEHVQRRHPGHNIFKTIQGGTP